MSSQRTVRCNAHRFHQPPTHLVDLIKSLKKNPELLTKASEIAWVKRIASRVHKQLTKDEQVSRVWDYNVRTNEILVALDDGSLPRWVPYNRELIKIQNPEFIVTRIGALVFNGGLFIVSVQWSNIPECHLHCAQCLLQQLGLNGAQDMEC
jgi:hypothetical protein